MISSIDEDIFKRDAFYVAIDSIIAGIKTRYKALNRINDIFPFVWQCLVYTDEMIHNACIKLSEVNGDDISLMALVFW